MNGLIGALLPAGLILLAAAPVRTKATNPPQAISVTGRAAHWSISAACT